MGVGRTVGYILRHPLNESRKLAALGRFARWQVASRLAFGPTLVPFVNGATLVVSPGMTGATQNIYTGLHELAECSFLLHLLRPTDLFVDVGSNVGVYTVLASASIGATSVAIEPIPSTYAKLRQNVLANDIDGRVRSCNIGLAREVGVLRFTSDLDTCNHVVDPSQTGGNIVEIPVFTLDETLGDAMPLLIKIDVEGWESDVLAGSSAVLLKPSLRALIVEMDSGQAGMNANEQAVHATLLQHGFAPFSYNPFTREMSALASKNPQAANTIYARDVGFVRERLTSAPSFRVNGREI